MYTMVSDNAHAPTVEETSGKEVESVEPPTKKRKLCLADIYLKHSGWF